MIPVLAACARPVGDFGRAQDSVLHDEVMPWLGNKRAAGAGEPVSSFNFADEELEMRDRVWRYLTAPHAKDWFFDTVVEFERTRLMPEGRHRFAVDLYYRWLTSERFASSRTRYNRLKDDIDADLGTLPAAFESICIVIGIDRQRDVAVGGIDGLEPSVKADVLARRAENRMVIGWFARALNYRYEAYGYALDHLLVETPHEEAVAVNAGLSDLAVWVGAARTDDYCRIAGMGNTTHAETKVRSRFLMTEPSEGQYHK